MIDTCHRASGRMAHHALQEAGIEYIYMYIYGPNAAAAQVKRVQRVVLI